MTKKELPERDLEGANMRKVKDGSILIEDGNAFVARKGKWHRCGIIDSFTIDHDNNSKIIENHEMSKGLCEHAYVLGSPITEITFKITAVGKDKVLIFDGIDCLKSRK